MIHIYILITLVFKYKNIHVADTAVGPGQMKHIVSRLIAPCQYHKAFISPPCVIRHGDHITSSDRQLFSCPSKSAIGPYPALGLALDCQNLKNLRNNFCHLFRVRTSPSLSIASLYM